MSRPLYEFKLNKWECNYLLDCYTLLSVWPENLDFNAEIFIKKVGRVWLELMDAVKPETPAFFTLDELWMIRDIAKSAASVGNEKVGISLQMKALKGIFLLEAEDEVLPDPDITTEIPDIFYYDDGGDDLNENNFTN